MRTLWRKLGVYGRATLIVAVAALLGVTVVAASGVYSVAASKGHWSIVEAFLKFGLRRSVHTHSLGITAPNLDEPAMIAAGIGHYEIACAGCHGAPGQAVNPITLQMLPPPPHLPGKVSAWTPSQLFWITKHGLKYTGMPGWAARGRDDEVWSVVAALVQLRGMDGGAYRRLVGSDTVVGPEDQPDSTQRFVVSGPSGGHLVACARCHGVDGDGGGAGAFPRLAGQSAHYMQQALADYANGSRPSGIMGPIAAALEDSDRTRLATYYAARPAKRSDAVPDDAGRRLATEGDAARGIPACASCHAVQADAAISPLYPRLAGQHAWYLRQQLILWRDQQRDTTPLSKVMAAAARTLTDQDIASLAAYYAGLPPLPVASP